MASGTVLVTGGAIAVTITGSFPSSYQVQVAPSWITSASITGKTSAAFTVSFAVPAPSGGGALDWVTESLTTGTAGDVILSIRSQIPDVVADPANDGQAFTFATLARWINFAGRTMATRAPVVQDWWAIQSTQGQMTYPLPANIVTVEQLWYDLFACQRASELDDLYTTKITARSYFFGPHAVGSVPVLHLWPAADRTGQTTTINQAAGLASSDGSLIVASLANFKTYGYLTIDAELIKYETVTTGTNTFSVLLRGQGGTAAASHANQATVTENNVFFKVSRLPQPITSANDPIEIPLGLTPLIELYVLAKVRQTEQEHETSMKMMEVFDREVDKLAAAYAPRGQRQGLQVRLEAPGPVLYFGRVVVP